MNDAGRDECEKLKVTGESIPRGQSYYMGQADRPNVYSPSPEYPVACDRAEWRRGSGEFR